MVMKKIVLIAVFVLAAAVAPVQAKPPKTPPKPHKCQPHAVSYIVSGTLDSGALTANSDGTYSGSLTVHVTNSNSHAKADKGAHKTYTLSNTKVKLHGENPAALTANSRVHLEGTIATLAKKCDQTGFTATIAITKADIKPPKNH
jgi:hypothetical protein